MGEDLIVQCPKAVVAPDKILTPPPSLTYTTKRQYLSNYTPKPPQSETSEANKRYRGISRTVTQESLQSAIEMSSTTSTTQMLAARRFPMKLLCEMEGAVIDLSGEMLGYRILMKRDDYRVIWRNLWEMK